MAAIAHVEDIPDDEHPAVLLVRAHELTNEADDVVRAAQAKADELIAEAREEAKRLVGEAAKLRSKADRLADGAHLAPKRRFEPADPMLSAAGLKVEEYGGRWDVDRLARDLQIRDRQRVVKIVHGLEELDVVERDEEDGFWRTLDPEEPRVRDALRELGVCSRQELAAHLKTSVAALEHFIEIGAEKGWAHLMGDGDLMYQKPGPERVITRRPSRRPPEKDPPSYTEAPARGEAVRVVHHGKRGGAMSNPGQRHRIKQRDKRREAMEEAKTKRAEEQKAKAARDGGRRRK
jgi:hypothetical protein